jgi:hypothetical protein
MLLNDTKDDPLVAVVFSMEMLAVREPSRSCNYDLPSILFYLLTS